MAHLLRLIAVSLLLVCATAHAAIPTQKYKFRVGYWPGEDWLDSASAACARGAANNSKPPANVMSFKSVTTDADGVPDGCNVLVANSDGSNPRDGFLPMIKLKVPPFCTANSTPIPPGDSCKCDEGYAEGSGVNAGQCVPKPQEDPCKKLAGQDAGEWWKDMPTNAAGDGPVRRSFSVCDGYNKQGGGKCVATVANATCTNSDTDGVSGFWRCSGSAYYTGTSGIAGKCDAASAGAGSGDTPADPAPATPPVPGSDPPKPPPKPDPGTAAPAPCAAGQAPGSVNGTTSCYPTGSDTPKAGGKDSSTKNSDGSEETKHEETTCNAGGSKCQTTTTTCTTPAGGAKTCSTSSSTDTATGTCAKSPGNSVCAGGGDGKGESSFGGDCKAGFQAKGEDPVLNAMALEQYKRNCELLRTDQEPSTWLTAEGQKTGNRTNDNPNNGNVSIGPGNFDTSDALGGGGGCNLNKTITVRGLSVALPFDVLCDPLAVFGQILVAVSMLLAARIVTRG